MINNINVKKQKHKIMRNKLNEIYNQEILKSLRKMKALNQDEYTENFAINVKNNKLIIILCHLSNWI